MTLVSLRTNPDGTARATLVEDTGALIEEFGWVATVFPSVAGGLLVQLGTVDGATLEDVTVAPASDPQGAAELAAEALALRARTEGHEVTGRWQGDEQEEPLP